MGGLDCGLATSYSNNNFPLIPFYRFIPMFGFQRVWGPGTPPPPPPLAGAAGDISGSRLP